MAFAMEHNRFRQLALQELEKYVHFSKTISPADQALIIDGVRLDLHRRKVAADACREAMRVISIAPKSPDTMEKFKAAQWAYDDAQQSLPELISVLRRNGMEGGYVSLFSYLKKVRKGLAE